MPFDLPFVQRALVEVLVLAAGAGVLGTWIVLRGLSFYAHAVGTAAFPGLVVADGLAFSPRAGALGAAALMAVFVAVLARRDRGEADGATALALVGALALGVILASDVFHSPASVDQALFGSLLAISWGDVWTAVALAAGTWAFGAVLGRRWLAAGFDAEAARALGARSPVPDVILMALIAFAAITVLAATGALLATAILVVPAATARLFCDRLPRWQLATAALAAAEGVGGVWLAVELNAPPGATIAVISAAVFAIVALLRPAIHAWRRRRRAVPVGPAALAALVVALAAVVSGCGSGSASGSGDRADVVVTTTQLGDIAREVGGPAVKVVQILHPNSDPHEYEPRPDDVRAAARADLVVTSGDGLDAWMAGVLRNAGGDPHTLVAGDGVPVTRPGERSGPEASRFDPHWWHDPRNVAFATGRLAAALEAVAPAHRGDIAARASRYVARVQALDRGIAACMARVPATQRKLVTDHDAFGYFAARYGIAVVGAVIPSQSTQAQPSAGALAKLSATIRREHVRAIFPETSINPRLAEALARQTGARADLHLYGDTLGPAGSPGATYLGMEQANADAMVRGFTAGAQRCRL
jgi:ABC-type Zn uptake system ZnuABC Zn-binding protein ZnuA/ABC-type Mn2+/Zn2+ transport system permease subunit